MIHVEYHAAHCQMARGIIIIIIRREKRKGRNECSEQGKIESKEKSTCIGVSQYKAQSKSLGATGKWHS